jgi:2-hydroxy-6-oxonona-2,4-dienedioate hydrolase
MAVRRSALILPVLAAGAVALVISRQRARVSQEPKGKLRSFWTRVNGWAIHGRVSVGPVSHALPVVLVHGYGVSGSYMIPIARRIAAEFPTFVPDLPGHGRSEKPERTLDIPELAETLRGWMDAVGLGRVAFLANSMGCQIVAELAVRYPERVERIIFVGPTADPEARTVAEHLPRFLRTGLAERLSLPFLLLGDYLRARPRRAVEELDVMFEDHIEDKLPRIEAPSMVLRGERDYIAPQRWVEEVADRLGADRLITLPNLGHALNYSAPDELMRFIRPFLRAGDRGIRERA